MIPEKEGLFGQRTKSNPEKKFMRRLQSRHGNVSREKHGCQRTKKTPNEETFSHVELGLQRKKGKEGKVRIWVGMVHQLFNETKHEKIVFQDEGKSWKKKKNF